MKTRFSACAAPAQNSTAAKTAATMTERMEPPTGAGSAAKPRVYDGQECDGRVKAVLTPPPRKTACRCRHADSRRAVEGRGSDALCLWDAWYFRAIMARRP